MLFVRPIHLPTTLLFYFIDETAESSQQIYIKHITHGHTHTVTLTHMGTA